MTVLEGDRRIQKESEKIKVTFFNMSLDACLKRSCWQPRMTVFGIYAQGRTCSTELIRCSNVGVMVINVSRVVSAGYFSNALLSVCCW